MTEPLNQNTVKEIQKYFPHCVTEVKVAKDDGEPTGTFSLEITGSAFNHAPISKHCIFVKGTVPVKGKTEEKELYIHPSDKMHCIVVVAQPQSSTLQIFTGKKKNGKSPKPFGEPLPVNNRKLLVFVVVRHENKATNEMATSFYSSEKLEDPDTFYFCKQYV